MKTWLFCFLIKIRGVKLVFAVISVIYLYSVEQNNVSRTAMFFQDHNVSPGILRSSRILLFLQDHGATQITTKMFHQDHRVFPGICRSSKTMQFLQDNGATQRRNQKQHKTTVFLPEFKVLLSWHHKCRPAVFLVFTVVLEERYGPEGVFSLLCR